MGHKLLLVEDDEPTAAYIVKGMSEEGFTVDRADNGRDGLFLASDGSYDAIVLDRMRPGMDGMAVLGALRALLAGALRSFLAGSASLPCSTGTAPAGCRPSSNW